jgi:hypothetical protein
MCLYAAYITVIILNTGVWAALIIFMTALETGIEKYSGSCGAAIDGSNNIYS